MRSVVLVAVAAFCVTTVSGDCSSDECMDQTCDYWDHIHGCDALEDYGCDCGGCNCSGANNASWTDLPVGVFGFIGGGFKNSVSGSFTVTTGGYGNSALDSYAAVGAGFKNAAFARFATTQGGGRNTARGRFSLATGYKGDAMKDYTASFGFNGETCATRASKQMAFCAKSVKFNDFELLDLYDRRRADEVAPEDLHAVIAAQRQVIAEQNERLQAIEEQLLQKGLEPL